MNQTLKTLILGALVAASLSACSGEAGEQDEGKGANSEARTTAFKAMMPEFVQMGKIMKGEEPYKADEFKNLAATFAKNSQEPFKHFTRDGAGQDGDALPAVWDKPQEFATAEANFHQAVDKLNAAAQTGNLDEIKTTYGETGATCKACHQDFRRPD